MLAAGREGAQASLFAFDENGTAGESSSIFGEAVDEHIVMVEEVEGLGAELKANTLGYFETLAGSKIEIPGSRSAERIAARRCTILSKRFSAHTEFSGLWLGKNDVVHKCDSTKP